MDLTGSKEILNGYRVKVDTILLAGGLCAGLIRYFVPRRGMQRLAALVQAIAREGAAATGECLSMACEIRRGARCHRAAISATPNRQWVVTRT